MSAAEGQYTPPAADADDETTLGKDDAYRAGFSTARRYEAN